MVHKGFSLEYEFSEQSYKASSITFLIDPHMCVSLIALSTCQIKIEHQNYRNTDNDT